MFVDTNILVSARITKAPHHDIARQRLAGASRDGETVKISRQVLREYLAVLTRPQPWQISITLADAMDDVQRLSDRLVVLEDGPAVTQLLIALCREIPAGGRQIHGANIVATMLAHGEHRLLTFNAADFRRYGNRIELVTA